MFKMLVIIPYVDFMPQDRVTTHSLKKKYDQGRKYEKGSESWVEFHEIQNLSPSLGRMNLQRAAKSRNIRGKYRYAVREAKT